MTPSSQPVETRLRTVLRLAATAIFLVTPLELLLAEHTESPIQLFPFGAALIGLVGGWAVTRTGTQLRIGRGLLVVVMLVGLLGLWEHIEHNFEFEREIQPNLDSTAAFWKALFGASPLLAPGILILGALLAWASALERR
jgi:hypothetical protein